MIYTKDEFKKLWESDETGGGITYDDVAECAKEWGLCSNPRTRQIDKVLYDVCKAAGVREDDLPYNPEDKKEEKAERKTKLTSDMAMKIYNFVKLYHNGDFGFVTLQEAIDKHFKY